MQLLKPGRRQGEFKMKNSFRIRKKNKNSIKDNNLEDIVQKNSKDRSV